MAIIARLLILPVLVLGLAPGIAGPAGAAEGSPAALVEAVENAPKADVGFLDYVYPGKVIELGSDGMVTLSYFETCLTETITGGRVKVARGASEVEGGKVDAKKFPCEGGQMVVTAETGEAGATVSRVTPFAGQDWMEYTVNIPNPIFKWPATAGVTTLRVLHMDYEPPKVVWEGEVDGNHLAYPADAPPLEIGFPYQVQAMPPDGQPLLAMFSFDPDLDLPDTAMARVIPLRR